MYIEEFRSPGPLTAAAAEELAFCLPGGTSQVTVAANDRSVNLPVLPWCWSELGIGKDTRVTITAQGGYRPADLEDRRALEELVTRFRVLTAPDAGQTPKTRSTTALARRVIRR
ncbi:HPr family phosphocarrier protein [Nocardia fusca]|uniref:HPr family phosphocarrier protein n=1 Tax=Nocardia fusca TaxID=941183 RepID=A0ABV3FER5_9NOCA